MRRDLILIGLLVVAILVAVFGAPNLQNVIPWNTHTVTPW
jgi:hypothetical protein